MTDAFDPQDIARSILHHDPARGLEICVSGRLASFAVLVGAKADYIYLTRSQAGLVEQAMGCRLEAFSIDHARMDKSDAERNIARQVWWRLLCHLVGLPDWELLLAPGMEYEDR